LHKHNLFDDRPSRELLARLIDERGIDGVLNPRSPSYKELDVPSLTKEQALDRMLEEPNLIRRPLVLSGKKVILGYKPEEYDDL
jgi:regulatory protein spx